MFGKKLLVRYSFVFAIAWGEFFFANSIQAQVLYTANGDGTMSAISADGTVTAFTPEGFEGSAANLAIDGSGTIFVTESVAPADVPYPIVKISPTGVVSSFVSDATLVPIALAFAPNGNLYVSNYTFISPGKIVSVTPDGTVSLFTNAVNSSSLGLAFNKNGDLFASNFGSDIQEITPDGTISVFATGLPNSYALAFDSNGNLYSANAGDLSDGSISKITPDGTVTTFVSDLNVHAPYGGLVFDSQDNLFASAGSTIYKITSDGTVTPFANNPAGAYSMAFVSTPAPEPSTWCLLIAGMGLSLMFVRARC